MKRNGVTAWSEYRIPVKSWRWYRYLAFFLFETAIVNAYILRQLSPNHGGITQLDFRLELLDKLIGNYSSRKRKRASTDIEVLDGKSHFPVRVTLNRCVYCASRNQRHRSTWGCVLCDVILCVSCFEPFHTRWRNLRRINMARTRISNLVTEQENGVFHLFPKLLMEKLWFKFCCEIIS